VNDIGEFDRELLELSGTVKGGYLFIVNNAGKAIALITLAVCTLVIFAEVGIADIGSAYFTAMLVAMLLSSYIIYFSLEDSGERLGERSEEYRAALEKYKLAKSKISSSSIAPLRSFCIGYSASELKYRRESLLTEAGYTEEEYAAYRRGARVSLRERICFCRADRMRAVKLTPALLLSGSGSSISSELENPEKKKLLYSFLNLLPSTLCIIMTVSVILTVRGDLTLSVILDGMIKLSALPIIGFRGYCAGYSFVKEKKSVWLETKARLLESFVREEAEKA
jgi:hypothetical protein